LLRKVAVSFAMLALPLSSPWAAIAGQPDPADVQAVDLCLKNAKSANSSPDSCIGVVAKACQASASTAQAKEACNQRE